MSISHEKTLYIARFKRILATSNGSDESFGFSKAADSADESASSKGCKGST